MFKKPISAEQKIIIQIDNILKIHSQIVTDLPLELLDKVNERRLSTVKGIMLKLREEVYAVKNGAVMSGRSFL